MTSKEILLFKFSTSGKYAPKWEDIPNDLGSKIVNEYFLQNANGIGFSGFSKSVSLTELDSFKHWQPHYLGVGKLVECIEDSINDTAVYELTAETMIALGKFPYQEYSIAFDGYATDDFIFFKDLIEIGKITPHEGRIEFIFDSLAQKMKLLNIDARIKENLHPEQELINLGV